MKGAQARREKNRAEMKQAVLDAAQKLVGEKGIEGLSLRGIARELGYSPAALYEYFESLDDIVLSLYYEGTDGLTTVLAEVCESQPEDTDSLSMLIKLGTAFRAHALQAPELYRFTYNVMKQPKEPEASDDPLEGGLGSILRVVHRGIEAGELRDVEPFVIVFALWTGVHGFVSLEVSDHFSWLRETGLTEVEGQEAISALYQQIMLGVLRGWATEKGEALLPS